MSGSSPDSIDPSTEARLQHALAAFQTAFLSGVPIDRDAFLAEYADITDPLRCALDAWLLLQEATAPPRPGDDQPPERLGDFVLLREIGRGGMGVVYEAVQESLDRRVAVKVLGRAAGFSELERLRFRQEAQATALLHHPHIVTAYFVGEDDGVLYYAMHYIAGRSLADVLHSERHSGSKTTPVEVAHWIEQAARALHYAHEQGFVHRDIKPANLLLDAQGHVWLTDFGLAYSQRRDGVVVGPNAGGTPGYLSPEQLGLVPAPVDRRADVFALGVTLYELLTLHLPFPGNTHADYRQALGPGEAVPPRKHRRDLPIDLQTIALKALAKDPAERYATARALADDLRRYQECRPILAHPPSLWQRASKFVRRHRRIASVLALLSLLVLAVTVALVVRTNEREKRLRAEREYSRRFARELTRIAEELLSVTPQQGMLRRHLLEQAAAYYEHAARDSDAPAKDRHAVGVAHYRLGNVYYHQGDPPRAVATQEKALTVFRALAAEFPQEPQYRFDVFHTLTVLTGCRGAIRDPLEARVRLQREALETIEQLTKEHPDDPKYLDALGSAYFDAGYLILADPEAEAYFRRTQELGAELARAHPERANFYRRNIVRGHIGLAQHFLSCRARVPEAMQEYRATIDLFTELVPAEPDRKTRQEMVSDRAGWQMALGDLCHRTGELAEAETLCREALATYTELHRDVPESPNSHYWAVMGKHQLAEVLVELEQDDEAESLYRRFRTDVEALAAQHDRWSGLLHAMIRVLADCPVATVRDVALAEKLTREWLARHPEDVEVRFLQGLAQLRSGGRDAEAKTTLKDANSPSACFALAIACTRCKDAEAAREAVERGNELLKPWQKWPDAPTQRLRQEALRGH